MNSYITCFWIGWQSTLLWNSNFGMQRWGQVWTENKKQKQSLIMLHLCQAPLLVLINCIRSQNTYLRLVPSFKYPLNHQRQSLGLGSQAPPPTSIRSYCIRPLLNSTENTSPSLRKINITCWVNTKRDRGSKKQANPSAKNDLMFCGKSKRKIKMKTKHKHTHQKTQM